MLLNQIMLLENMMYNKKYEPDFVVVMFECVVCESIREDALKNVHFFYDIFRIINK